MTYQETLSVLGFNDALINELTKYPKENLEILGLTKVHVRDMIRQYETRPILDVTIDANANIGNRKSPNNLQAEVLKPVLKLRTLELLLERGREFYGPDFDLSPILGGDLYFHDATKLLPYCVGASALDVLTEGRPYANPVGLPPRKLRSFMGQVAEFVIDMSQQFAGAVALTDLMPCVAWITSQGDYDDKAITDSFQSLVHICNNPYRSSGDSPFTNLSINSELVTRELFNGYAFPDFRTIDSFLDELFRVQTLFVEFMARGDPSLGGLPYKFPVVTANFLRKSNSDSRELRTDWWDYIARKNKKGFININISPRVAMCCRLNLDFDVSSFGNGGLKVGSSRVVTLNLPYLRSRSATLGDFLDAVADRSREAIKYLLVHRSLVEDEIDALNLYIFKNPQWYTLDRFKCTIGVHGLPDSCSSEEEMIAVLDTINEVIQSQENPKLFNVEQTPAESATVTMAKFVDDGRKWFSNQFVPLDANLPLRERLRVEGRMLPHLSGGGIAFLNFDSELDEEQSLLVHERAFRAGVQQFVVNYGWSSCGDHTTIGRHVECPTCGKPTRYFERVVGYLVDEEFVKKDKRKEMRARSRYGGDSLSQTEMERDQMVKVHSLVVDAATALDQKGGILDEEVVVEVPCIAAPLQVRSESFR